MEKPIIYTSIFVAAIFGVGIIMPFGKYDLGTELLSKWNTNKQTTRWRIRVPYIQISYNIQWGRQKNSAQKLINANANTDSSTTGAR